MEGNSKPQGYQRVQTKRMVQLAILAAIAIILNFIQGIPIIPPFYKLDFSTLPVWIAAISVGPIEGVAVAFVKALSGLLHSSSSGVGELADFLCSSALVLSSAYIYRARNGMLEKVLEKSGASLAKLFGSAAVWTEMLFIIISTAVGIFALVLFGALSNYFILIPFYAKLYNLPVRKIVAMIQNAIPSVDNLPKLIMYAAVPFNLLKGAVLAVLTWPIYSQIKKYIKR